MHGKASPSAKILEASRVCAIVCFMNGPPDYLMPHVLDDPECEEQIQFTLQECVRLFYWDQLRKKRERERQNAKEE